MVIQRARRSHATGAILFIRSKRCTKALPRKPEIIVSACRAITEERRRKSNWFNLGELLHVYLVHRRLFCLCVRGKTPLTWGLQTVMHSFVCTFLIYIYTSNKDFAKKTGFKSLKTLPYLSLNHPWWNDLLQLTCSKVSRELRRKKRRKIGIVENAIKGLCSKLYKLLFKDERNRTLSLKEEHLFLPTVISLENWRIGARFFLQQSYELWDKSFRLSPQGQEMETE